MNHLQKVFFILVTYISTTTGMIRHATHASRADYRLAVLAGHFLHANKVQAVSGVSSVPVNATITGFNFSFGDQQVLTVPQTTQQLTVTRPATIGYDPPLRSRNRTKRVRAEKATLASTATYGAPQNTTHNRLLRQSTQPGQQQTPQQKIVPVAQRQESLVKADLENYEEVLKVREHALQAVENGDVSVATQTYTP